MKLSVSVREKVLIRRVQKLEKSITNLEEHYSYLNGKLLYKYNITAIEACNQTIQEIQAIAKIVAKNKQRLHFAKSKLAMVRLEK